MTEERDEYYKKIRKAEDNILRRKKNGKEGLHNKRKDVSC